MAYGLQPEGFIPKDLNLIAQELRDEIQNNLGADVNVDPDSVIGQLIDIFSAKLSETWELGENIYGAFNANTASGDALDNLYSLLGVSRQLATRSSAQIEIYPNAENITVYRGTLFEDVTGVVWELMQDLEFDDSGDEMYGEIRAVEGGPIVFNSPNLDLTPVEFSNLIYSAAMVWGGWGVPGRYRETDSQFRLRARKSLYAQGVGTQKSMEARLLSLEQPQLIDAKVYTNRTTVSNSFGPAKSYSAYIYPPLVSTEDRRRIAEELFASQPAGIVSGGSIVYNVKDQQGLDQQIRYSNAVEIYVDVAFSYEHVSYQQNSQAGVIIEQTLTEYINNMRIGEEFRDRYVLAQCYSNADLVNGVLSFTLRRKSDNATVTTWMHTYIGILGDLTIQDEA